MSHCSKSTNDAESIDQYPEILCCDGQASSGSARYKWNSHADGLCSNGVIFQDHARWHSGIMCESVTSQKFTLSFVQKHKVKLIVPHSSKVNQLCTILNH